MQTHTHTHTHTHKNDGNRELPDTVLWLGLGAPKAGDPGSTAGPRTRSHMLQQRPRMPHSQINNF